MNGTRRGITKRALAALAMLILGLGTALIGLVGTAGGANAVEKVGVCHRTASDTNPYVYISVPADEANGHITGDAKNHKKPRYWKSDGTWRGDNHAEGDEKWDYLAPGGAGDCQDDTPPPPPETCPEGTDKFPEEIPEGEDVSWCDETDEQAYCPEDAEQNPGLPIPEGETEESYCTPDFKGSDTNNRTLTDGDCEAGTVTKTFQFQQGEETAPGSGEFEYGPWETVDTKTRDMTAAELDECDNGGNPGGGGGGDAEVLGIEANAPAAAAPAAAPTAVDAGVIAEQSGSDTSSWLLAGAALALMGAALGLTPARVRGKRVR